MLESGIIDIFTLMSSSISTLLAINIVNNYIAKVLFFYAKIIIFNLNCIISMFVIITLVINSKFNYSYFKNF